MLIFIPKVISIYCSYITRNKNKNRKRKKKKRTMMMTSTDLDYKKLQRHALSAQNLRKKIPRNQRHEGQQYQRLIYLLNKKSHVFRKSPTGRERRGREG